MLQATTECSQWCDCFSRSGNTGWNEGQTRGCYKEEGKATGKERLRGETDRETQGRKEEERTNEGTCTACSVVWLKEIHSLNCSVFHFKCKGIVSHYIYHILWPLWLRLSNIPLHISVSNMCDLKSHRIQTWYTDTSICRWSLLLDRSIRRGHFGLCCKLGGISVSPTHLFPFISLLLCFCFGRLPTCHLIQMKTRKMKMMKIMRKMLKRRRRKRYHRHLLARGGDWVRWYFRFNVNFLRLLLSPHNFDLVNTIETKS